jgi:hypothetical protein
LPSAGKVAGRSLKSKQQKTLFGPGDRPEPVYFRAAQAYMLISMPTDTSTIFGVFQVIQPSMNLALSGAS